MKTSECLANGTVYTRHELREKFDIADQTINTGIFRPRGHDSVWLFVTEQKAGGMTEYEDRLDGDTLYWQGQTSSIKDKQIVNHAADGLELVVFFRETKNQFPGYGFRFEGAFEYVSHRGTKPASFVLRRARGLHTSPTPSPPATREPFRSRFVRRK
jgi:putative restriction endonuclease